MAVRVGLVGLGMMGRNHARVLRSMEGVEFVGIVEPLGDLQGAGGGVPVLSALDALLALHVDACVLAVPTAEHEELGCALAAAGVATLVEKPVAADAPAARRMGDAFAAAGVLGCVGHIERYNPAIQSLQQRLGSGDLGDLFQITTSRQGPFPARVSDVGVVKDLGTHDLDLTTFVSGSEFATVAARTAHRTGREHEDLAAVVGCLDDGVVTSHLVNWLTPLKERRVVVTGERGCLVADTLAADLTYYANGEVQAEWSTLSQFRGVSEGDVIRYAIPKPEPLRVELEAFVRAARGEAADVVTLRDGLRAVIVADAVVESAATGSTVHIRYEEAR
jgi:predicted dehydrogenase